MAPVTKAKAKVQSVKLGQFVTPAGSALFVSCPNASQFDDSKQEASIILQAEQWDELKIQIDKAIVENNGYALVPENKMQYPIKDAVDKENNLTGDIILKAKTGMQYPAKLLDAKGKPIVLTPGFTIANRSKIRLAIGVEVISSGMYKGVICRLNAVKVISASPFGSNDPFADYEDEGDFDGSASVTVMDTDETDSVDWTD